MLYAHGFDPATAERYRRIMARSGAERVSAPPVLSQVAQMSDVSEGWRITADHGDGRVETVFEILRYEDIVRQWQGRPLIKKLWSGLTAWFAHRIAECVNSAKEKKVDEILIVGHSLGGLVAVRSLARAMEQDVNLTGGRAKISLLTLGSVSGYVSCHGGVGADRFGLDVVRIASDEDLTWVDVSAPRDWFSFGLVDPLLLLKDPPVEARSPRVISAKFGKASPDPDDKRTRFRAMGLHMKYLAAPDKEGGFDFLSVVSGEQSLKDRFQGRRNSPRAKMLTP